MKMAAKIVRTTKKALELFNSESFGPKNGAVAVSNDKLQELISLASQITAKDINFDLDRCRRSRTSAPVSYMEIFSNSAVTVCVFVLWEGSKMPMHNHPDMYGILKVLHGTVRVQSYSLAQMNNNNPGASPSNPGSSPSSSSSALSSLDAEVSAFWNSKSPNASAARMILSREPDLVLARKHVPEDLTAQASGPAVLRPTDRNIHQISPVGGPAAFLDILAPPYKDNERDCEYFLEVANATPGVTEPFVFLKNYEPRSFWSDKAAYLGPRVVL